MSLQYFLGFGSLDDWTMSLHDVGSNQFGMYILIVTTMYVQFLYSIQLDIIS